MNEHIDKTQDNAPTLSLKAGGWVILCGCILSLALIAWALASVFMGNRPIGDGSDINTYAFDLGNLDVPVEIMAASGNARDFLDVYTQPESIPGSDILAFNQKNRRPWIVTEDRVVGIEIDGEPRAYPVRCLNAHEIIHDDVNGHRITVTYAPFADAPVVILQENGEEHHDYGVSGLLCNSSLVMYDRNAEVPSLWSPLLGRAISGPMQGTRLETLPEVNVCTWEDWLAVHPETRVILPDQANNRRYKAFSYLRYFNDRADGLKFPAAPLPEAGLAGRTIPRLKSRVVAVTAGADRRVYPLTMLVDALGPDSKAGTIELVQGGIPIRFTVRRLPQSVLVQAADGSEIAVAPMLFFAWWSTHPETVMEELVTGLPEDAVITLRQQ